ncbi:MAG: hypothetical protein LBB39_00555 [Mycoplasmataceae bacterium]|jgi:DNA polymerase-3 subunit beta|nr:hypothetical protein [Mycoplasmataceae bacterium]
MEFAIDKKLFASSLKKLSSVVKNNDINNVYAYIKIDCNEEEIFLYANNEIMGARITLNTNITIKKTGSIDIEYSTFSKIIDKISSDKITLKVENNSLLIIDNKFTITLNLYNEQEIEELDFSIQDKEKFVLNEKILTEINKKVVISCIKNKDDITPYRGVYASNERIDGIIEFVCTDTCQLSYMKFPYECKQKFSLILFPVLLSLLNSVPTDAYCYIASNRIICQQDNIIYNCALVEGKYQSAIKIIESNPPCSVYINNNALINCIEKAIIVGGNDVRANFSFNTDKVVISCQNIERGVYLEDISYTKEEGIEQPIKLISNPSRLLSLLKCIDGENVLIQFTSSLSPILIKDEKNQNFIALTLPLRR